MSIEHFGEEQINNPYIYEETISVIINKLQKVYFFF